MRVFVTGNLGYVGSVLTPILVGRDHEVIGCDTNYYRGCGFFDSESQQAQVIKDVRDVGVGDLHGCDAVIHLAALSNDPLGEMDPRLTEKINRDATVRLAEAARAAGVKRFVFASTQSIYGISATDEELDEDASAKNPVTAYARAKWEAEQALTDMAGQDFAAVVLRPGTVFGASPMLRCDIVFNNLVACAYATGKIEIKSDGTPWRPVVHVRDVARAFVAAIEAPSELVSGLAFNVGIPDGNFTVRQLAEAAERSVPGSAVIFTGEHGPDSRTYRVSFKKILTTLKDYYKPTWSLDRGGRELVDFFDRVGFTEEDFRGARCNRVAQVRLLLGRDALDSDLRWQS